MSRCYYLILDLQPDDHLMAEYERHHQSVWPEIEKHLLEAGILRCEIFRFSNRLMMRIEVKESFTFEAKEQMDKASEIVQRWEELMDRYQQRIPGFESSKWQLMSRIYFLKA